jgi:hypothetical protein
MRTRVVCGIEEPNSSPPPPVTRLMVMSPKDGCVSRSASRIVAPCRLADVLDLDRGVPKGRPRLASGVDGELGLSEPFFVLGLALLVPGKSVRRVLEPELAELTLDAGEHLRDGLVFPQKVRR